MQIRIEVAPVEPHELPDGEQISIVWQPRLLLVAYSREVHPLTVVAAVAAELGVALQTGFPL